MFSHLVPNWPPVAERKWAVYFVCGRSFFDVFFELRRNKRLSKHSRRWWFESRHRATVMNTFSMAWLRVFSEHISIWYLGIVSSDTHDRKLLSATSILFTDRDMAAYGRRDKQVHVMMVILVYRQIAYTCRYHSSCSKYNSEYWGFSVEQAAWRNKKPDRHKKNSKKMKDLIIQKYWLCFIAWFPWIEVCHCPITRRRVYWYHWLVARLLWPQLR